MRLTRRIPALALSFALLLAAPAWAIKEWYDYYHEAEKHMKAGQYAEALKALQHAVELEPTPGQRRTYGLEFVDYFPYYDQGLCQLKLGDYGAAIRLFNIELEFKQIHKQAGPYQDLLKLKSEAETAERQQVARKEREDVNRLLKESTDLARAKKYPEALARLAEAEQAGSALDNQTQHHITEMRDRLRDEQKASDDAAARNRRLEETLADARHLLETGKDSEASVRFDEVLAIDPRHTGATDGKREAQERVLARKNREALHERYQQGKQLFDTGRYEDALPPLTDAALDDGNPEARALLEKTQGIVEGIRRQRDISRRVADLLEAGEQLLATRKYPEAQVRFESVLALDPGNVRAAERRGVAERLTGEALFDRWMPPQSPVLTFFEPKSAQFETKEPMARIVGVASDDRSVARLEFVVDGRLVADQPALPQIEAGGEAERQVTFDRAIPLSPGVNVITVIAVDGQGLRRERTFRITRRPRLYERPWFLPAGFATSFGLVGFGLVLQRLRQRRALRRRFNPYIAGAPVLDESMFFGRKKLLARILNVLHHNSLMITGERRIGKTTLLYHLRRALEIDEGTEYRFFPVFIDLQGVPETGFFYAVMADIVEALALSPETTSALRFRPHLGSGDSDPKVAGGAREDVDYFGRDFSHDLQRIIEELKGRTPKKVKLALLIDEVDVLNSYSERINQRLRSIFMKTFSEHLVAIMSGVGVKRIWNSEGSPWYNFFDEIELAPFGREEAEALIRQPVQAFFRYDPEAVETILHASGGKPYLIQRLCIHAVNRMLEQGRTTMSALDVKAAIEMDRTFAYESDERESASA